MTNKDKAEKQRVRGANRKERELYRMAKKKGFLEYYTPESYLLP